MDSVIRFDHHDFVKAIKLDLGPILSDMGLWSLKCLKDQAKQDGDNELKKKYALMFDIVEKFLESSLEVLGQEKKYSFMNKFGPKKFPDMKISRADIKHLYSWAHYAPQQWYDFNKRREQEI